MHQQSGQYLVQQAKLGVFLLWVFASRVRVFLHQENISLFTLKQQEKHLTLTTYSIIRAGSCSKKQLVYLYENTAWSVAKF